KVLGAVEVRAALELAVDEHLELVIPGRNVADVDSLHAALVQRIELFEAVDVVRHELAVDLDPHGVEAHFVALGHRDEDRELRPRRVQQLLLKLVQVRRDAEDVRLDLLDLFVESPHLLLVVLLRPGLGAGEAKQEGKDERFRDRIVSGHVVPLASRTAAIERAKARSADRALTPAAASGELQSPCHDAELARNPITARRWCSVMTIRSPRPRFRGCRICMSVIALTVSAGSGSRLCAARSAAPLPPLHGNERSGSGAVMRGGLDARDPGARALRRRPGCGTRTRAYNRPSGGFRARSGGYGSTIFRPMLSPTGWIARMAKGV